MSEQELTKHEPERERAPAMRWRNVAPVCDVYENADEYLIVAEMPGIEQSAVDVRLDRTRLSIEAARMSDDDSGGTRYARVFEVPATIDASRIAAQLRQGVLSVHLPKAPQARVRRIEVHHA